MRSQLNDPQLRAKAWPDYTFGCKRILFSSSYLPTLERANVELVSDAIASISAEGIVSDDHALHEIDCIIWATGFKTNDFMLPMAITGRDDVELGEYWSGGAHAHLGMCVPGFPNMFTPTGAGSVSLLANLFWINKYHVDWIADCIDFMRRKGHKTMEASDAAAGEWGNIVAPYAERLLRRTAVDHYYRVHYNDDGSRIFMAFTGGMHAYHPKVQAITANGYEGFIFD